MKKWKNANGITIVELAKEYGVTARTVYRKIKYAGLDITDMRDENGRLFPRAISTIRSLFDDGSEETSIICENNYNMIDDLQGIIAYAKLLMQYAEYFPEASDAYSSNVHEAYMMLLNVRQI